MRRLVVLGMVGLIAQLIDGSMGMGYGTTSSTMLLAAGFTPTAVAASVHAAEVATSMVSATAHWRLGNVDWRLALLLAVPGGAGAVLGAVFLASIPADTARLFFSVALTLLGVSVLYRFSRRNAALADTRARPIRRRLIGPLGLVGGFVDASGGGGWGPITASTLMAHPGSRPRKVVGSVNTAEVAVTLAATITFAIVLGRDAIHPEWFVALLAGGVVAAPVAAFLVRFLPAQQLGLLVGGMILITNGRTLAVLAGADPGLAAAVFGTALGGWFLAVIAVLLRGVRAQPALVHVTEGD